MMILNGKRPFCSLVEGKQTPNKRNNNLNLKPEELFSVESDEAPQPGDQLSSTSEQAALSKHNLRLHPEDCNDDYEQAEAGLCHRQRGPSVGNENANGPMGGLLRRLLSRLLSARKGE